MQQRPEPTVSLVVDELTITINVVGDLDLRVAHVPYDLLAEHLERGGGLREVVVDLSEVDFVDSTGLGGLIRVRHEAAAAGATTCLSGVNLRLRQLLTMTGLDQEFELRDSAA